MLPDYLLQSNIDEEISAEIRNHLLTCNECNLELEETRRLLDAFCGSADLIICTMLQQSIDSGACELRIEVDDRITAISMGDEDVTEPDDPLDSAIGELLMARLRHMADVPLLQDSGHGRIFIRYRDQNLVLKAEFSRCEEKQSAVLAVEKSN